MSYSPRTDTDARYVNVSGDTMTGDLVVTHSGVTRAAVVSTDNQSYMNFGSPSGQFAQLGFTDENEVGRWAIGKNNTPETGSNAGSDLELIRFSDAEMTLSSPFKVIRSTGRMQLNFTPTDPADAVTKQYSDSAGPQGGAVGTFSGSLPNSSQTTLTLAHTYLSGLSRSTNTVTVTKAGWWAISARAAVSASIGTTRAFLCIGTSSLGEWRQQFGPSENYVSVNAMCRLAVNDTFTLSIFHSQGTTLSVSNGNWFAKFLGNE